MLCQFVAAQSIKVLQGHSRTPNSNGSRATAVVALGSEDLVVVRTELLAVLRPSVKVVLGGDGAADTLGLPDRPELLEG